MDLLEFDALVVERSKAKVDVKVAPRLVVEQMLGGDPRLRRSPRRVQGLSDTEDLLAASARWFLEDRVLLLWHVESSGPVHATLSDPKLGRKGGVGGAFGSPFEDASAVSRAMGFLRSAEECHNGPPEIASRLFQKLTTTPALDLTCSSTQGRSPSAEEAALAGAIAPPLTSKPCAPGPPLVPDWPSSPLSTRWITASRSWRSTSTFRWRQAATSSDGCASRWGRRTSSTRTPRSGRCSPRGPGPSRSSPRSRPPLPPRRARRAGGPDSRRPRAPGGAQGQTARRAGGGA